MTGLIDTFLKVLELAAVVCAVGVVVLAIVGLVVSIAQVTLRGRVFVIPFRGADAQRVDITILFASRLADIEVRWRGLADDIQKLRGTWGKQSQDASHDVRAQLPGEGGEAADPGTGAGAQATETPIADLGDRLNLDRTLELMEFRDVAGGPRTIGDEVLDHLTDVAAQNSLADIDFGTLTVAGVSFSLQAFVALFRRLPGVFARRVLHGAISPMGAGSSFTVTLEQRPFPFRYSRYRVACTVHVHDEDWIGGVDSAAYGIAKARLDEFRMTPRTGGGPAEMSKTVAAAEIEARTWAACEAFLEGYAAQLRHYVSGRATHRDAALAAYATALEFQPTYTRAAYNRATLLYNLYVPAANDEAIRLFGESTATLDQRARALAFAGQAMAYGQAVLRFGKPEAEFVSKAVDASQDALGLAPDLEESRFAVGWAHQLCKEWQRAIAEYEGVRDLGAEHAAGRRITSFALNNAGWIWLSQRTDEPGALEAAESYLWAALRYYPNKVAFVNLAEIARRKQAYETALKLFAAAVELDPCYVNAWNERAILELEIARAAALRHDAVAERRLATDAEFHHRRALHLAGDDDYRQRLTDAFRDALGARALTESG